LAFFFACISCTSPPSGEDPNDGNDPNSEYEMAVEATPKVADVSGGLATSEITVTLRMFNEGDANEATGDYVEGKEVTFSHEGGVGSLVGDNPVTTDPNGQASINVSSSAAGTALVKATVADDDKSVSTEVSFIDSPVLYQIRASAEPDGFADGPHPWFMMHYVRLEAWLNGELLSNMPKEWEYKFEDWIYLHNGHVGDVLKIRITPLPGGTSEMGALWLHYWPLDDPNNQRTLPLADAADPFVNAVEKEFTIESLVP